MEKNGKERFGAKVELGARANEDTCFAVNDHELIQEMQTDFHKLLETGRREALALSCPRCVGKLRRYEFMGFVLDRCASCEGVWLDKADLDGIVRKAARDPDAFLDRGLSKD